MHLSPLSDGYQRDTRDSAQNADAMRDLQGRAFRDGLLRGLAVLAVLAVLMGLGFISTDVRSHETSRAPFAEELRLCVTADC